MKYIDKFIECGKICTDAKFSGDYKSNNKAYKRMFKILDIAKDSEDAEKFYLTILKRTDDPITLINCCSHMLKLQIQPELARKTLEEIRDSNEIHPFFSSEARIYLQEWDKGSIKRLK